MIEYLKDLINEDWFNELLLHISGIMFIIIVYFGVKSIRKLNKDIKELDERSRKRQSDMIKSFSRKKENENKLKFE